MSDQILLDDLPTPEAIDQELRARGLVVMKAAMSIGIRRAGEIFACSAREAAGHDAYGSAERLR